MHYFRSSQYMHMEIHSELLTTFLEVCSSFIPITSIQLPYLNSFLTFHREEYTFLVRSTEFSFEKIVV